jgi:hypothetical protein
MTWKKRRVVSADGQEAGWQMRYWTSLGGDRFEVKVGKLQGRPIISVVIGSDSGALFNAVIRGSLRWDGSLRDLKRISGLPVPVQAQIQALEERIRLEATKN